MTEQPEKDEHTAVIGMVSESALREQLQAEITHLRAQRDQLLTKLDDPFLVSEIERLRAQRDQLLAALNLVMTGGNHIATYRTDRWPSYGTEPADALEKLGAGQEYDMWCCSAAIMTARAAVANQDANSKVKG